MGAPIGTSEPDYVYSLVVGAGLGVAFGLLLLHALVLAAVAFVRRRRHRHRLEHASLGVAERASDDDKSAEDGGGVDAKTALGSGDDDEAAAAAAVGYGAIALTPAAGIATGTVRTVAAPRTSSAHRAGVALNVCTGVCGALGAVGWAAVFLAVAALDRAPYAGAAAALVVVWAAWAAAIAYTRHVALRGGDACGWRGGVPWSRATLMVALSLGALAIIAAFVACFLAAGVCRLDHPKGLSTRYTRSSAGYTSFCTPGSVCLVYAQVPPNLSTQLLVNFQTADRPLDAAVTTSLGLRSLCTWYYLSNIERDVTRYVASCFVDGLPPATEFTFTLSYTTDSGNTVQSAPTGYRTGPADGAAVRFVAAGDVELGTNGKMLAALAGQEDPDFVLIGGDIAYTNGYCACYYRWDSVLSTLHDLIAAPNGRVVPWLFAIGNHEGGGWALSRDAAQNYLTFFTWVPWDTPGEIPLSRVLAETPLFHSHTVSSHVYVASLDSGVVDLYDKPAQLAWMERDFALHAAVPNKFVAYHAPLYPSYTLHSPFPIDDMRRSWLPLFDKHHVRIAFENHVHAFKRTHALLDGVAQPANTGTGTVYVGDGCIGIKPRAPNTKDPAIFVTTDALSHVWVVEARADGSQHVMALGFNSTDANATRSVFDEFSLPAL